jgi:hypothetical protein
VLSIGCLISSLGRGLCSGIDSILLGRRGCTGGVSTRRVTVVGGFSSSGSESFLRWRVQQWRVNQAARTELEELISMGWRYTGKIGCVVLDGSKCTRAHKINSQKNATSGSKTADEPSLPPARRLPVLIVSVFISLHERSS